MNALIYFDNGSYSEIKNLEKIIVYPYSGEANEITNFEKFKLSKKARYTFVGKSILVISSEYIHHVEFYA